MPPKPINISASSFVDLKAQIAQQTEQFERARLTAKHQPAAARRSDKKPTVWARQNKGVSARSQRDKEQHLEEVESHSLARSREALERKAQIYENLKKRVRTEDDDNEDEDEQLIDFDRKYWEELELRERQEEAKRRNKAKDKQDQNDKDEDKAVDSDEDPWVEFEDEFGRTRVVRKSQLPEVLPDGEEDGDTDVSSDGSRTPPHRIPRSPTLATRADIIHYDANKEARTTGVGFYQFATDEEQRAEQMERLNKLREETEEARRNAKSVAEKRKAMLSKNAEKIHARRAALLAKRCKTTSES